MARKKHRKKSHRRGRRRHSIGAVMGKNAIMNVVGIAAGVAAGRIVSQKLLPNVNATYKSAGVMVLGMFFPKLVKGPMGQSLGTGMIAAGSLGVMQGTGILGAIDQAIDGFPMVGAFNDVGAIEYEDTMGEITDTYVDDSMGAMDEEE